MRTSAGNLSPRASVLRMSLSTEALASAAAFLNSPDTVGRRPRAAAAELAWHLDAVGVSLAARRDLLQSRLATGPGGERVLHSEWGSRSPRSPPDR